MKDYRNLILGFIMALAIIIGVVACQKEPEGSPGIPTSNISTSLQNIFQNKYRYVTAITDSEAEKIKSSLLLAYQNNELGEKSMEEFENIRAVRLKSEMKYESSKVQVDVIYTVPRGLYTSIYARVSFALTTNAKDEETGNSIVTKGYDVYHFDLAIQKDSSLIVSETKVYLSQAPRFVIDFINSNPVDFLSEERTYSGSTSATWATLHWNNVPSTGYYDYTPPPYNGDCTNFVSHCLKQGGWVQENAWHWLSNGTSCDYNMTTCQRSPSWTGASQFYSYITGAGSNRVTIKFTGLTLPWFWWDNGQLNTVKALVKGDVGELASNGVVHHNMIVTTKSTTSPYVYFTYRNDASNSPRLDRPVDEIKQSFPNTSESMRGFYVKP